MFWIHWRSFFECLQSRMLTSNYAVSPKPENTSPGCGTIGHPPGLVISWRIDYGFEAGAAGAGGSEDAGPAAEPAAAAALSAAGAAGVAAGAGVASVVGAGASVLLPQALSTNAATRT